MEERAWFEQVYRQNVDLLFRVGRRLLDSDENPDTLYDMVQEIFLLLWDRRETLKTHPNIGGWLMAALKFRILGERGRVTRPALRHAYSLDDDGAAPVSDRALSPEERAVFAGHVQAIRRLLKPDMAELFIDYAVNGCTPQQLAQKNGLILLTDSDAAGFRIRNYITNLVGEKNVVQAYVPAIHGKEKRKEQPGKEGLLGVEGVEDAIVLQALRDALGAEAGAAPARPEGRQITYTDLYEWGLSGKPGSAERKAKLLNALGLPPRLSKKELVEALNRLYTFEQLDEIQASALTE